MTSRPQNKVFIISLIVLSSTFFHANAQTEFYGKVVDGKTGVGIPFVNIGFIDKGIGTTSNENGDFTLNFRAKELDDEVLILSSLGYKRKEIPLVDLLLFVGSPCTVKLEPEDLKLDEVTVFNDGQEFIPDKIGYVNYDENHYGYWKGKIALGAELATRILAKGGLRKLHKLNFKVVQPPPDSLLLRINIYNDDGGLDRLPGSNLNKSGKNIFCKVYSYNELMQVDLDPFNIYVNDDFIVSLELVEYYVKSDLEFALAASYEGWGSYRKYTSADKWTKFSRINLAYQVESSLLVSKSQAKRFKESLEKKQQRLRTVSGYVLLNNKMLPDVVVKNLRTGNYVYSDDSGKYVIHAKKGDFIVFSKKGFERFTHKTTSKKTFNTRMRRVLN